jgi:phosphoribosyl 1,2-cyclic phosphodiesterase
MVDRGFSVKDTIARMARLGVSPDQLSAVLVTHEHGDHIKGVGPLARKYRLPVYLTPGTLQQAKVGELPKAVLIHGYQPFTVGDIQVTPVAVPHDAREPCQYVMESHGHRLGVLTDLGSISSHVAEQYRGCDALVLESNHDSLMLAQGPYPPSLKRRVGSNWGHLNNQQAVNFLHSVHCERLRHIVVAHISEQNNCVDSVADVFKEWPARLQTFQLACQNQGFDWLDIGS